MPPMRSEREVVLVVGTTPDYIDWLRRAAPGEALFLTDPAVWQGAQESCPDPHEELRCDLTNDRPVRTSLARHLARWNLKLSGIACYDCESMELAAALAAAYGLPYPAPQAIRRCRDKCLSKRIWKENSLCCPETRHVRSKEEAADFLEDLGGPLVLKPLCGTGSELIFRCTSPADCDIGYQSILRGLESRRNNRIYRFDAPEAELVIAEELVSGEEYSCDFIIDDGHVELIRLTRKIRGKDRPFGTIEGYVLIEAPPKGIAGNDFSETLHRAAEALAIHRGICMLDFIVRDHEMVLLELAPRPGGDCLPFLLRRARQVDILKLNLDFARRLPIPPLERPGDTETYMGVRLIARRGGRLQRIDTETLKGDPLVTDIGLFREPGHLVTLPPADYNSWILGYMIARLSAAGDAESRLAELIEKTVVEIEPCC
jgi:hypothetical protein